MKKKIKTDKVKNINEYKKEKKNKYPQKKNKFLFSFLMSDILLLMI